MAVSTLLRKCLTIALANQTAADEICTYIDDGILLKAYVEAGQSPSTTPSSTVSATPSSTVSSTPSATPSSTVSATPSATVSQTPSATPSATESATPSET